MYVSERDKALIGSLPPSVTVASILREALQARRGCPHDQVVTRCGRCGAEIPAWPAGPPGGDPGAENGQVEGVASGSSDDAEPMSADGPMTVG